MAPPSPASTRSSIAPNTSLRDVLGPMPWTENTRVRAAGPASAINRPIAASQAT